MLVSFLDKGWKANELAQGSWIKELSADIVEEVNAAFNTAKCSGRIGDTGATLTDISRTRELLSTVADEIENGCGFVVLRGLPVSDYHDEDLVSLILGIGKFLGTPVPQTQAGNFVSRIEDLGKSASDRTVRGHQTRAMLPFHCDRADLVGLLCVRTAKEGGESRLVSAVSVHNVIAAERPDLLKVLYSGFPHDRRGEEAPGQAPWIELPVFAVVNGRFVSRYIRRFIDSTALIPGAPALSDLQREALDFVDDVIERPGMVLDLDFRPGDLQLLNNCTIWHSRNEFLDFPEREKRRLLLRLWIAPFNSRELPEEFLPLYGEVKAGSVRGGVVPMTSS